MTMWLPTNLSSLGPRYAALVAALDRDIQSGRIAPGAKLLPVREMAYRLGLSVGTVTRAYQIAQKRGLVSGEVGRGSFVRATDQSESRFYGDGRGDLGAIDLSLNLPPTGRSAAAFQQALVDLSRTADLLELMQYLPHSGLSRHRHDVASWWSGHKLDAESIALTNGAQHAMALAIAVTTRPGDVIVCEHATYAGIKALANYAQLRLIGADFDIDGVNPESLETVIAKSKARLVYLVPNLQNPTATILSAKRRERVAEIIERRSLYLIEADVYGFLLDRPLAPIAALIPERTFYVGSFSKCLAPGLRVGFVAPPRAFFEPIVAGVRATTWMATPLMAEVATHWMREGIAESLIAEKRVEACLRGKLAVEVFGKSVFCRRAPSYHIWLELPEHWSPHDFVNAAQGHGITLTPTEAVVVGAARVNYVRICLGAASSATALEQSLRTLKAIVEGRAVSKLSVV